VEALADLLFAFDTEDPDGGFYSRVCEATCRLAEMDRAVLFLYDATLRRVRAVGSHGIELSRLSEVRATVEKTPIALRALSEDRVVETADSPAAQVPAAYADLITDARLVCTPMSAAGRWPGVIFAGRAHDRPLTGPESHLLWTLGKVAALAASARGATRAQERARQLQDRIDLAREIHDGVIQRLFGVSMALSSGAELDREERRRAAEEIQDALADLRTAVQRPLGRSARATQTTLLDEVRRLADEHPQLHVVLEPGSQTEVPAHLEPVAQSVLTEALRNAAKHAQPTRVGVRVTRTDGTFLLEVTNDGVRPPSGRTGMGLRLAAFEALQHGGVIEFGAGEDERWRVRLLVPAEGRP
jgi:signal transduction histidine kinase